MRGYLRESPLSHLLYVFYNANLVESQIGTDGGSIGFIDDFTAWRTGPTRSETTKRLQSEVLRTAVEWVWESGASFEVDKTAFVHLDRRRAEPEASPPLRLFAKNIEARDEVKILGVILDAKLHMKAHIDRVVQAATKKCLAIRRLRELRPK